MSIYHQKRICCVGLTAISLAVFLTGCDSKEAGQTSSTNDITVTDMTPKETEAPAIDSDMVGVDKAAITPTHKTDSEMSEKIYSSVSFPAKFQGRWTVNVADCPKARGMETTVMIIDDKSVQFYESMASLNSATQNGDTFKATLRWTGEGQNWDSETAFTLKDGGKMLTRADAGIAEVLIYKKCPT